MTSDNAHVPAYPTQRSDRQSLAMSQQGHLPPYTVTASAGPSGSHSTSMAESRQEGDFFDIAPRSDSTSFQVGYLGLDGFDAWVKGDVLVKLDSVTKLKGAYTRCTVQLSAVERIDRYDTPAVHNADVVELFSHTYTLWDVQDQPPVSSSSSLTPPAAMPFSFSLTEDLPHCIHLRNSSLTYQIVAKLISADTSRLSDAIKTIPVHLVRYTHPGPLDQLDLATNGSLDSEFSLQPRNWIVEQPTTAYVQVNRSIFRRAEPIDIRVHIPPPHPASMTEKGLKLRAVEADLVRIISVKNTGSSGSDKNATQSSSSAQEGEHEALLAHSGKLCRFHSQRPVLLRLTLHPPFDRANMPHPHPDHDALTSGPVFGRGGGGGCESISQETLMHKVFFEVRIKVGIHGAQGERRDIVCRKRIKILPGAAGALEGVQTQVTTVTGQSTASSEKERLKQSDKAKAVESQPGASSHSLLDDLLDFGMEDEYDGYEDVGRSLDDMDSVDEPAESSSTHEERLEQLRQLLDQSEDRPDDLPPTLLESQHDLQVEVELEGVGLAMPRHPADTYASSARDDFLSPPPSMTDSTIDDEGIPADEPPPPPISPLVHTDHPHNDSYQLHEVSSSHPGVENGATDDASLTATGRHEPPPYLYGETVPSFDQAIRQQPSPSILSMPTGAGAVLFQRRNMLRPATLHGQEHTTTSPERDYARPPAYGTSPHPPSYDA